MADKEAITMIAIMLKALQSPGLLTEKQWTGLINSVDALTASVKKKGDSTAYKIVSNMANDMLDYLSHVQRKAEHEQGKGMGTGKQKVSG